MKKVDMYQATPSLVDKSILVTGASSGIGKAARPGNRCIPGGLRCYLARLSKEDGGGSDSA